jgi:hypothetical protein
MQQGLAVPLLKRPLVHSYKDKNMTHSTMDQMIEQTREIALEAGVHGPIVVAEASEFGTVIALMVMPESHHEKLKLMYMAGRRLAGENQMHDLVQVFYVSEAWMLATTDDDVPTFPLEENPLSREVIIIYQRDLREQRDSMAVLDMIRDDDGTLVDLPISGDDDGALSVVKSPMIDSFMSGFRDAKRERMN